MSSHAQAQSNEHAPRSVEAMLKAIGVPLAIVVAMAIRFAPTSELSLQEHKALALFGGIFVLYLMPPQPAKGDGALDPGAEVVVATASRERVAKNGRPAAPEA